MTTTGMKHRRRALTLAMPGDDGIVAASHLVEERGRALPPREAMPLSDQLTKALSKDNAVKVVGR